MFDEVQEVDMLGLIRHLILIILALVFLIILITSGYELIHSVESKTIFNRQFLVLLVLGSILYIGYAHPPKLLMYTEIKEGVLVLKLGALVSKTIKIAEIADKKIIDIDPIADFGGYGYRLTGDKTAFIAKG